MPTFDWTISLSDVFLLGGGILAFGKIFLAVRDTLTSHDEGLRALKQDVGASDPPSGLKGDVKHIRREQQEHREWLIRGGLDK